MPQELFAKVKIEVSHKGRDWRLKIYEDGEQIGEAAIGCSEKTVCRFVAKLIVAYNPLPPKPPSVLATKAIQPVSYTHLTLPTN